MILHQSSEGAPQRSLCVAPCRRRRIKKKALIFSAFLPFIILNSILLNQSILIPAALAAPLAPYSAPGHNTFQQFQQQNKANQSQFQRPSIAPGMLKPNINASTNKPLPSAEPAKMHDLTFVLDDSFVLHRPAMKSGSPLGNVQGAAIPTGTTPLVAKGSDGRLEVQVPRGSLDFAHAALADGSAPVGQLILQVHQIAGHFIEADSILGTYQLQIVDSQGHIVQGVQVLHPLTIIYHYQPWEMQDLNIDPSQVHLSWSSLLAAAQTAKQSIGTAQAASTSTQSTAGLVVPMSNNAAAKTLTAQTSIINGIMTASATPEIQAPGKPDLFETSGNSGQYSYSYPISVVAGPDGFMPQLALSYSSQSTNGRHGERSPAGDEGEGFSLGMGSITSSVYPSSSTGGAATWFSINGVDGLSDKLVPNPDGQTTTYITQHITGLKIEWTGSHWRVWAPDGTFYELGGTSDSTQATSAGTYEWDVSKVLAPYNDHNGLIKTMIITYLQDSPSSGTIRDAGIKQIQYGYASTTGASSLSLVAGTVDFHYHMPSVPSGQSAFATAYGTNYNCFSSPPSSTTLRCDDPVTFNSVPAPTVMPTMTLDSVTSFVGADSANQPAFKYSFTYQDQPYNTSYTDAYTYVNESATGEHLLTQITPTVYVQGTAHQRPGVVFGYTGVLDDHYHDPNVFPPGSSTNHFNSMTFWQYLNHYEDLATGEGANITYARARANMFGTPYITDSQGNVIDDRFDPFYCDNQASNPDTSKQCNGKDYDSWSVQVVTQISALGTDSSGNKTVATTKYHYSLSPISASRDPVNCNPITGTGVPPQEAECVSDSWSPGFNGTSTPNHDGDWQDFYHQEYSGFNIVYTTSAAGNLTADYFFSTEGWWTPTSNGATYNGGQLYQEDVYQGNVATPSALLRETLNYYSGVGNTPAGNPYSKINSCNGNLSAIYNPCVIAPLETKTIFFEGNGGSANAPFIDTKYTYDDLNGTQGYAFSTNYNNKTKEVISGSNLSSTVYRLTKKWVYTPDDGTNSNGVTYHDVNKVTHSEIDDNSGHVWLCQNTTYDEGVPSGTTTPAAGMPTTVTSFSTCGNASTAITTYSGYDQFGNVVASVDGVGTANASSYANVGCTLATAPAYITANWHNTRYTACTTYDTTHTVNLPLTQTNALGQTASTSYDYTSGTVPSSTTDANSQVTGFSVSYSGTNEVISVSQPGETGSYTTRQSENSQCTGTSTLPCYEIDSNNSLYPNAISRTFYDAQGRAVETRTPGPTPGNDTVVMTVYNDQNNTVFKTVPFQVAAGSGWIDPNGAKDINGNVPAGTTTFMDALGRTIAMQDPNFGSAQEPGLNCSTVLTGKYTACTNYSIGQAVGDSTYYSLTTGVDPNGHVSQSFADSLGNVRYTQSNSGVYGGTLTVTKQTQTQYNVLDKPTSVVVKDKAPQSGQTITSVTTTMTYDDIGRLLMVNDPDQGTLTYSYDPDSHVTSVVQTSGSNTRTLGTNYDLLGRIGCEQTAAPTFNTTGACSAGNPLLQNTYDTTFLGTKGSTDFPIGNLTQSVATTYYPDGTSATVTNQVQTDQRGRAITHQMQLGLPSGWNVTSALPAYQLTQAYNDANQPTTTATAGSQASYTFSQVYDPTNGVLQGLSNNGNATANLATLAYNEFVQLGSITLLNGASSSPASIASETFNYDANLRPLSMTANWLSGSGNSGQILGQSRSFDNASNVTSVNNVFAAVPGQSGSGGTETQNFCYDEQNRMIWSGNGGTQPGAGNGTCGNGALGNTISGAGYTAPFSYTNLGQIWLGPVNGQGGSQQFLYCNSQPHQLSGIYPLGTTCANKGSATASYSAGYDPWGNITSRTYNNVSATFSYDQLNRLVQSNVGSNQEFYVYDASGQRVLKRSTSGGTTTLTGYAFGLQELTYTGSGVLSNQVDYYSLAGHLIGSTNGTTTAYDLTDALGSVLMSISSSAVLGEQVYGPYGNQRYSAGTMGTDKGYTGQFHDNVTGLDYYNARYYDPVIGQFLSPDSVQGNAQGMSPYAYVAENPETMTDPTGQYYVCQCGGSPSPPPPPSPPPSGDRWFNDPGMNTTVLPTRAAAPPRAIRRTLTPRQVAQELERLKPTPADQGDNWEHEPGQNPPVSNAPSPCGDLPNCNGVQDKGNTTIVSQYLYSGFRQFFAVGYFGLSSFIADLQSILDHLRQDHSNDPGSILEGLAGLLSAGYETVGIGFVLFAIGAGLDASATQSGTSVIQYFSQRLAALRRIYATMGQDEYRNPTKFNEEDMNQVFVFTETTVTVNRTYSYGRAGRATVTSSYEQFSLQSYNLNPEFDN